MAEPIIFSEPQQYAVLGHALAAPQLWNVLDDLGVNKDWLVTHELKEFWTHLDGFRKSNSRVPKSRGELISYVETKEGSAVYLKAFVTRLDAAQKHAGSNGWDLLERSLIGWSKARVVAARCTEIGVKYNKGEHEEAFTLFEKGANDLRRLDLLRGGRDQMISSATRGKKEREQREAQAGKFHEYGIKFLDDALGGIQFSDFILLGGYTGCGKTEAAKIVAEHNARQGKHVGFFALEAEEDEIERRIKFGKMMQWYKQKNPGSYEPGRLNYLDWRMGKLDALKPFEDAATGYIEKELSTLHTYYRANSNFSVHTLDREILRHYKKLDIIILDHIHYIDSETSDENQEMLKLMKKISDLVKGTNVPVVAIAHLRKKQGTEIHTVMPSIDSFHGSSNISKVATTAILMGKARGLNISDTNVRPSDKPTYIRPAKCRLDGSRCDYVGLGFFNPYQANYADHYAVGRLNLPETAWNVLQNKTDAPYWAKNAKIWDISEEA